MIVLDTNVVSELMRATPAPVVLAWLQQTSSTAGREADGNPISGFDGQIAAICRSQVATLATRNTKDFVGTGIPLIDPWQQTTT